mmetsp:Transcript_28769/g.54352  ORF Transcript_28769/g.54352 Transcript_28769/m.54352 type:complete len:427 (-) Transcript_28769:576-1856(-)
MIFSLVQTLINSCIHNINNYIDDFLPQHLHHIDRIRKRVRKNRHTGRHDAFVKRVTRRKNVYLRDFNRKVNHLPQQHGFQVTLHPHQCPQSPAALVVNLNPVLLLRIQRQPYARRYVQRHSGFLDRHGHVPQRHQSHLLHIDVLGVGFQYFYHRYNGHGRGLFEVFLVGRYRHGQETQPRFGREGRYILQLNAGIDHGLVILDGERIVVVHEHHRQFDHQVRIHRTRIAAAGGGIALARKTLPRRLRQLKPSGGRDEQRYLPRFAQSTKEVTRLRAHRLDVGIARRHVRDRLGIIRHQAHGLFDQRLRLDVYVCDHLRKGREGHGEQGGILSQFLQRVLNALGRLRRVRRPQPQPVVEHEPYYPNAGTALKVAGLVVLQYGAANFQRSVAFRQAQIHMSITEKVGQRANHDVARIGKRMIARRRRR